MTFRYESELQAAIIKAASERGHRLFDNPQGLARYSNRGRAYGVKYGCGGTGAPDLIGWTKSGAFAAIEVKLPGKKPKKHQDGWRRAALTACPTLRIGWADSVEGALEILEG
jgi:hypothetical protein